MDRHHLRRLGLQHRGVIGRHRRVEPTWDDCEQFLAQLGYAAQVEVTVAGSALLSVHEKSDKKYG